MDATIVQSNGTKQIPATLGYELVSNGNDGSWLDGIANGKNSSGFQDGEAVGFYFTPAALSGSPSGPWAGGFTYLGGATTSTQLYPGAIQTDTLGVNNLGQIVGNYNTVDQDGNSSSHGFYAPSNTAALQTLDYPGAAETVLTGINDAGWIVGTYTDQPVPDAGAGVESLNGSNAHCALWKPDASGAYSSPVSFDVPGQTFNSCSGINGLGQIVGWFTDPNAMLYTSLLDDAEGGAPDAPTNFTSIPDPNLAGGSGGLSASGINNNGLIAGNDYDTGLSFLVNSSDFDEFAGPVNAWPFYLYGINDDAQMAGIAYPAPNPSDPGDPAGSSSGIIVDALP